MDNLYMRMALELAIRGRGNVSPNPLVGAVIVKNGEVIGKGYHEEYGKNHAEVNAINNASEPPEGATMYVTLEPCTVYGNTPPCADRIIKEKFKRVVIAQKDPNPNVNGKGIEKLREAGIEVSVGILESEAKKINVFYNNFITRKRPFFTLKAAMTLDAKLADLKGKSKWITNDSSRRHAMYLRFINDAVLVGAQTVRQDDPHMDIREFDKKRPFYKIILSKKLDISEDSNIFRTDGETIIFCGNNSDRKRVNIFKNLGARVFVDKSKESVSMKFMSDTLYGMGIQSVLVEGGAATFSCFIDSHYCDRLSLFYAPKILGKGIDTFGAIMPRGIDNPLKIDVDEYKNFEDNIFLQGDICSRD